MLYISEMMCRLLPMSKADGDDLFDVTRYHGAIIHLQA
jgi:hypothetical protein